MFHNEQDFSLKEFFSPVSALFFPVTTVKAICIIAVVGLIVFANSLFNGFVLDDKRYIISNPSMYSITPSESFLSKYNIFNADWIGQYRPIPALYFSLLYSMFTTAPFYYHGLSLLIHITNTILLFFLLKHFFNRELSLLLSLVFLVHPIQVESISYIAAADNPLFFLFGISALLLGLKSHISRKQLIAISCLTLLSLLLTFKLTGS
jgi:hypothetical protein